MRVLFDQGTPAPLRRYLTGHEVETAFERGWSELRNSELLDRAEEEDFGLLITTDQSLRHQQDLQGRKLSVLVLLSTSWPRIRARVDEIASAIDRMEPGSCIDMPI